MGESPIDQEIPYEQELDDRGKKNALWTGRDLWQNQSQRGSPLLWLLVRFGERWDFSLYLLITYWNANCQDLNSLNWSWLLLTDIILRQTSFSFLSLKSGKSIVLCLHYFTWLDWLQHTMSDSGWVGHITTTLLLDSAILTELSEFVIKQTQIPVLKSKTYTEVP